MGRKHTRVAACAAALLERLENRLVLSAYVVTSAADSGPGTLREAISSVDAGTNNEIDFNIAPGGVQTIAVKTQLPTITATDITIDGTTQPGFRGMPLVVLNGSAASGASGLLIYASRCVVRGLVVGGFAQSGITIGNGTVPVNDILLAGNYIGTDATGETRLPNLTGITLNDTNGDTIGGAAGSDRNVVSGNTDGILLSGASSGNQVLGNYVGTEETGVFPLPNQVGILVRGQSNNNLIGGTSRASGNVVSGNSMIGIGITDAGTMGNVIAGNRVGTDKTGTAALGNGSYGIVLDQSDHTTVGGSASGARNLISGNVLDGVEVLDSTFGNDIEGNYIGTDATGTSSLPNNGSGVGLAGNSHDNTLRNNVVSGNAVDGMLLRVTSRNIISSNFVGVGPDGKAPLANALYGVAILGADTNTIGGTSAADGNVISGNVGDGVHLESNSSPSNLIEHNLIGTDVTGTLPVPNHGSGVGIQGGASGNTVASNTISGNFFQGVFVQDPTSTNNLIQSNRIGTDVTGALPIGNGHSGVLLFQNASGNTVDGNTISGNLQSGVELQSGGNRVVRNFIGTNTGGIAALGNGSFGIHVTNAAAGDTIGGTAGTDGNVISGNASDGVDIAGAASRIVVSGNFIGTNATGTAAVPNHGSGIGIIAGSADDIRGNVIGGNFFQGVFIQTRSSTGNRLRGNFIGTNADGSVVIPNGQNGVTIFDGSQNNTVGGTAAGDGNFIAHNRQDGVLVFGADSIGNAIEGNSIHDNDGLGIDLSPGAGPLPNDPADVDAGPNDLQNYPVLSLASGGPLGTTISGSLDSTRGSTFRVEFFASPAADSNGFGEGQTYLGFTTVTLASGPQMFTFNAPGVPTGQFVTATATAADGSTSEFSLAVPVIPVTVSWTGGAHDGLWTTPGNWSTGMVPGPSDDVLISDPGTPLILLTNAQTIHSLFTTTPVAVTSGSLSADHLRFAASLTLGPGGTVGTPTLIIGPGSSLIGAGGTLAGAAVTGNVVVNASNTLFMSGGVTLVGGLASLSVATGAKVDVTSGTLRLPYGSATAPDSAVRGLISGGRITASGASVGFADSADATVSTLPPTTILVKPALAGDANLDGRVDFSDLLVLAQHYNGSNANWDQGDFTGDGNVGFNDLLALAQDYGRSLPAGVLPSRRRR